MAILSFLITEPTGIVGDLPRRGKILSTDTYTVVTTAGYLNGLNTQGQPVNTNDVFDVVYGYVNANSPGTYVQLIATVTAGIVTLTAASGDVILPVVSGDFAMFSGTMGAIADTGLAPSSTVGQHFVSTNPGSLTIGQIAEFKDANGTLENSGILASNVMSLAAVNTMAAGSQIITDKATASVSTGAVTINKQSGVITAAVTTAAAGTTAVTFNNSEITATSVVGLFNMGGTNTTIPGVQLGYAYVSPGVGNINITNNNVAGTALNGNLLIGFVVL